MSVEPTQETYELVQGSTFDDLQNWWDGPGETNPHDFTGEVAILRIGKDNASPAILTLTSVSKTTFPTDGDGIYLSSGVLRIYISAATLAGISEDRFNRNGCEGYAGRNTLIITTAGGIPNVENDGEVTFQPIVEPGP